MRALVREAGRACVATLDRVGLGPRQEISVGTADQWADLDDAALAALVEQTIPGFRGRIGEVSALIGPGSAPDGPMAEVADGPTSDSAEIDGSEPPCSAPAGPDAADSELGAAGVATDALLRPVRGELGPPDDEGGGGSDSP